MAITQFGNRVGAIQIFDGKQVGKIDLITGALEIGEQYG